MSAPVLLLTVGGSPEPILSAVRAASPRFVRFVVTPPNGGKAGSAVLLDGESALPRLAGLADSAWDSVLVPHDDPDHAFLILRDALRALRACFPAAPLIADYTGGTKSMSAALLAAVLAVPGVELQLMLGDRRNLKQVESGTERPYRLDLGWLLAEREAARLRAGWARFAYAEAAEGAEAILADLASDEHAPPGARRELETLRDLSALFAAWDRFAHDEALRRLQPMPAALRDWLTPWQPTLELLCDADPLRRAGAQCLDLWRNAERRAARGLYDDAVARCYRLLEAVAQWHLRRCHGIDSGDVDWAKIDPAVLERAGIRGWEGRKELGGLMPSLKLWSELEPHGVAAAFLVHKLPREYKNDRRPAENELRNMLGLRNCSILAHGQAPIGPEGWERFRRFCSELFRPLVLEPELRDASLPVSMPQLPTEPAPSV